RPCRRCTSFDLPSRARSRRFGRREPRRSALLRRTRPMRSGPVSRAWLEPPRLGTCYPFPPTAQPRFRRHRPPRSPICPVCGRTERYHSDHAGRFSDHVLGAGTWTIRLQGTPISAHGTAVDRLIRRSHVTVDRMASTETSSREEGAMTRTRVLAASLAIALTAGVVTFGILPSAAQEPPPPIATEFLTGRAVFPDDVDLMVKLKHDGGATHVVKAEDPSRTVVTRVTVQPGAQFPWHTHAGPVIVNVVGGTLVYVGADDCE